MEQKLRTCAKNVVGNGKKEKKKSEDNADVLTVLEGKQKAHAGTYTPVRTHEERASERERERERERRVSTSRLQPPTSPSSLQLSKLQESIDFTESALFRAFDLRLTSASGILAVKLL